MHWIDCIGLRPALHMMVGDDVTKSTDVERKRDHSIVELTATQSNAKR